MVKKMESNAFQGTSPIFSLIFRAWSNSPAGPFIDYSTGPLICSDGWKNSLDPSWMLDDDGTAYLVWKNDGQGGNPSTIFGQVWIGENEFSLM